MMQSRRFTFLLIVWKIKSIYCWASLILSFSLIASLILVGARRKRKLQKISYIKLLVPFFYLKTTSPDKEGAWTLSILCFFFHSNLKPANPPKMAQCSVCGGSSDRGDRSGLTSEELSCSAPGWKSWLLLKKSFAVLKCPYFSCCEGKKRKNLRGILGKHRWYSFQGIKLFKVRRSHSDPICWLEVESGPLSVSINI